MTRDLYIRLIRHYVNRQNIRHITGQFCCQAWLKEVLTRLRPSRFAHAMLASWPKPNKTPGHHRQRRGLPSYPLNLTITVFPFSSRVISSLSFSAFTREESEAWP